LPALPDEPGAEDICWADWDAALLIIDSGAYLDWNAVTRVSIFNGVFWRLIHFSWTACVAGGMASGTGVRGSLLP